MVYGKVLVGALAEFGCLLVVRAPHPASRGYADRLEHALHAVFVSEAKRHHVELQLTHRPQDEVVIAQRLEQLRSALFAQLRQALLQGLHAQGVKANDQAQPGAALDAVVGKVETALRAHPLFQSAARPKALTRFIVSRYNIGQTYGLHVDNALMQGLRTDLSFTLFLSDPASYDGGALVIEDHFEARAIKLSAGEVILYPATTLHRVEPVTRGTRLAVVGWVQSLIRDPAQREILFDLDQAVAGRKFGLTPDLAPTTPQSRPDLQNARKACLSQTP